MVQKNSNKNLILDSERTFKMVVTRSILIVLSLFLFFFKGAKVAAQTLEAHSSVVDLASTNSLSVQYDNDVGVRTDEYYTQGISIDLFTSKKSNYPFLRVIPKKPNSIEKIGFRWTHQVFTPTSILADEILKNDQPYSAHFQFSFIKMNTDLELKRRYSVQYSIGLLGPLAFGNAMQTFIHEQTGDVLPKGWKYQIGNQVIFGAKVRTEQNILHWKKFEAQVVGWADVGNLETSAALGFETRIGNCFYTVQDKSLETRVRSKIHAYTQSYFNAIAFNARLEGRLFVNDIYQLPSSDVQRLVFQQQIGIVFSKKNFQASALLGLKTKEFASASIHCWTGLRLSFGF